MDQVTQLLTEIQAGRSQASNELFQLVYEELRNLATAKLAREAPGHTLQATALVHEVFLRLVAPDDRRKWDSVGHFFAAAAESMRRILIENVRAKKRQKRGGDKARIDIPLEQMPESMDDDQLLAIDEALRDLEKIDAIKAKLVVMRFFGGLSMEDACQALGISRTTAHRYWTYARAWLYQRVHND